MDSKNCLWWVRKWLPIEKLCQWKTRVGCAAVQSESLESSLVPGLGKPIPQGGTVMPQLIIFVASRQVIELSGYFWGSSLYLQISTSPLYCFEDKTLYENTIHFKVIIYCTSGIIVRLLAILGMWISQIWQEQTQVWHVWYSKEFMYIFLIAVTVCNPYSGILWVSHWCRQLLFSYPQFLSARARITAVTHIAHSG